ncbi:OCIA domain-containing protein 1 [Caerostris darwini]|uniref:OCIA domain-containing protein 1 n=1 Tax=Caerostris darwini TaxID=1538125 RepID=A0AAV4VEY1_9ARAC|nr:OCIA domain-containing protein 1 [Caerostris darwini]
METDSPVVYHGTSESRFPPEQMKKRMQLELSQEEMRLFRECSRESFYLRCLPFATLGMTATFFAVKRGYLKSHPKWGPAGKMTGAALFGWFLGKISYRKPCEEKFLKLKNSKIGDLYRRKRGLTVEDFENDASQSFYDTDGKADQYTSESGDYHSSSRSLNFDVDKNITYSGLDDRERPSTDREFLNLNETEEPVKKHTTYEELRRKNREEYERRQMQQAGTKSESSQHERVRMQMRDEPPRRFTNQSEGGSKNTYGDVWDDPKFQ